MTLYRLTVFPAIEATDRPSTMMYFTTMQEIGAAKEACADLLLFLHDISVMKDYSNMFICEVYENGEWLDIDEEE